MGATGYILPQFENQRKDKRNGLDISAGRARRHEGKTGRLVKKEGGPASSRGFRLPPGKPVSCVSRSG